LTQIITPGRWRGLKATSTNNHVFSILAFDQRGSYRKMLPEGTSYEDAVAIKREIVVHLSQYASAVLLDPEYGMPAALEMAGSSGLLLCYEETGYSGDSTYRRVQFIPEWTISKIKQVGAAAVKLLVYYHPDSGQLAEELEDLIRQIGAECRQHDLPLFVEPMSYSLDANVAKSSAEFAATRPRVLEETARRLSRCQVDVLKLEFPVDAEFDSDPGSWRAACEAVSAASEVPWVLLSAGVDFDTFERQTRSACQAGASGFLAGRAIWKEAVPMLPQQRVEFLRNTASSRIQQLIDIAAAEARPWTDFYQPLPLPVDWYVTYPPAT
jgi:tagatose 1,6-diphosphate aldolase